MKHCLFFIAFIITIHAGAQSLKSYIPKGWILEEQLEGDLNKDGQADIVLILRNTDPKNIIPHDGLGSDTLDTNPRRLLVLFKNGSTTYKKVLSTDQFLPPVHDAESTCLMDPLAEGSIAIEKGLLKIDLHYWLSCGSWYVTNYSYTFRHQHNNFELIGLDVRSFHRASGETDITSINYSTQKKQVITGMNEFEPEKNKPVEKWEKIKVNRHYNLATLTTDMVLDEIQL